LATAIVASPFGIPAAHASDLPVTYAVQEKPLKTSVSGTPLTFTLFSDNACTQQVYQAVVPIQNVTLISRLKLLTPKGATKTATTDELQATLTGVTAGGNLYLTVTGTGVTPSGATCQVQAGQAMETLPTQVVTMRWQDSNPYDSTNSPLYGMWGRSSNVPGGYPEYFTAMTAQATNALNALADKSFVYQCSAQLGVGTPSPIYRTTPILLLNNCTALPPTCSDGLRNEGESDVDCGGPCPPCPEFGSCNTGTDCVTGACALNHFYGPGLRCVAATCVDGVQDNGETHVDCGNSFTSGCEGCAAGATCSNYYDCASGNCNSGVCQ
jgi:hypothetical protein